jgi:simple sugar transport system substrate-binding protein
MEAKMNPNNQYGSPLSSVPWLFGQGLLHLWAALCILPILLFMLGSCSKKNPPSVSESGAPNVILGFSQIGAESAWRNCNSESVREAAQAAGIQLLFENAEQKQENQIKAIRSFIAYQVDVIAFVPIVADGWDNVLLEARNAGIPVLVTDRKINISDNTLFAAFIGTDSVEEGRSAGKFLVRKFQTQKGKTPVRILELYGTEGASVAIGRAKGFREVIAENPNLTIVHSESGDFLRSRGYEIMKALLDRGESVDVLFSHNDSMTLGAMEAMRGFGLRPGKDVVIVTIDAEQAAIDALKAGEVNCVVECNPKTGPAIIDMARKLAAGEPIPWFVHVSESVFSEDDPGLQDIPSRGY